MSVADQLNAAGKHSSQTLRLAKFGGITARRCARTRDGAAPS